MTIDLQKMTTTEALTTVRDVYSNRILEALLKQEESGHKRLDVLRAIEFRLCPTRPRYRRETRRY